MILVTLYLGQNCLFSFVLFPLLVCSVSECGFLFQMCFMDFAVFRQNRVKTFMGVSGFISAQLFGVINLISCKIRIKQTSNCCILCIKFIQLNAIYLTTIYSQIKIRPETS